MTKTLIIRLMLVNEHVLERILIITLMFDQELVFAKDWVVVGLVVLGRCSLSYNYLPSWSGGVVDGVTCTIYCIIYSNS